MAELKAVFRALKEVMEPYAAGLERSTDSDKEFFVQTRHLERGQPLMFGAVRLNKNYVSYHLVPLYTDPGLLTAVSPELKKRMQGKTCFNFRAVDPALFGQLAELTGAGLERYKQHGYLEEK